MSDLIHQQSRDIAQAMADDPAATTARPVVTIQLLVTRDADGDFTVDCEHFPELGVCEATLPAALTATAVQIREIAMAHAAAEIDRRLEAQN